MTNGVKRFPNNAPIPGYNFGYQFDHIGNRLAATRDNRTDAYTNNVLNQIQSINYAPWLHVLGQVNSNAIITVNGQTPARSNGYFYAQLSATSIWNSVSVQARTVGAANNGADALAQEIGHVFQSRNSTVVQYDEDGNLKSDGRWMYTWNAENQLNAMTSALDVTTSGVPRVMLEFVLDSQGRRRTKLAAEVDPISQTWHTTFQGHFIYDNWQLLAETDTQSHATQSFNWGVDIQGQARSVGRIGALLSGGAQSTTGQTLAAAYTGNGDVVGFAGSAPAQSTPRYDYGPFGELIQSREPLLRQNPWRLSTKYADQESGLANYGLRYYNAPTGRWLSRDSFQERGGVNLYNFTFNDPVGFADSLGLAPFPNSGLINYPQVDPLRITPQLDPLQTITARPQPVIPTDVPIGFDQLLNTHPEIRDLAGARTRTRSRDGGGICAKIANMQPGRNRYFYAPAWLTLLNGNRAIGAGAVIRETTKDGSEAQVNTPGFRAANDTTPGLHPADRGHLIARDFGGDGDYHNLVTVQLSYNRSGGTMYSFEEKIRSLLNSKAECFVCMLEIPLYSFGRPKPAPFAVGFLLIGGKDDKVYDFRPVVPTPPLFGNLRYDPAPWRALSKGDSEWLNAPW